LAAFHSKCPELPSKYFAYLVTRKRSNPNSEVQSPVVGSNEEKKCNFLARDLAGTPRS
jgi:hypothetical protein